MDSQSIELLRYIYERGFYGQSKDNDPAPLRTLLRLKYVEETQKNHYVVTEPGVAFLYPKPARLDWGSSQHKFNEIIELCLKTVDEVASVRCGWAASQILGAEVQPNVVDKISAKIIENPRYLRDKSNQNLFPWDWNIRKNPDFKEETWIQKNPIKWEFMKMLIPISISITASYLINKPKETTKPKQENHQKYLSKPNPETKNNDPKSSDSASKKNQPFFPAESP